MPRNGTGTQSSPASSFPAVANTLIESSKFNNIINDINSSLTASIANDGQTPILADIPMSNFKLTGLSAGSAAGHSVEYSQMNTAINAVIPAGTKMPFYQASPPAGWTAATVQNDSMMRVVTAGGTGGTSGAGANHSPILNNVVPAHTHSLSTGTESNDHYHYVNDPGHAHSLPGYLGVNNINGTNLGAGGMTPGAGTVTHGAGTGIWLSGINVTHYHTGSTDNGSSQTNWQPRYMDFCIGEKS